MLNWGFIGAGSIARSSVGPAVHAATGNRLYAVASRDPNRARALEPVVTYSDYHALLADPSVGAVYVSLHNSAHLPWVRHALNAGKHVLCEKPLGLTADEVKTMTAHAEASGRMLVEAAWNRWHPRTRAWEDLLAAGELGEIFQVVTRFEGGSPSSQDYRRSSDLGGGALYDVGCYAVSAVLAAFDWEVPLTVDAVMTAWYPGSADVVTRATLQFAKGGYATIVATLDGGGAETLRIGGSRGVLDIPSPVYTAGKRWARLNGTAVSGDIDREYPPIDPYFTMVDQFSRAVAGRDGWTVPSSQSVAVATVIDLIRSAASLNAFPWPTKPRKDRPGE